MLIFFIFENNALFNTWWSLQCIGDLYSCQKTLALNLYLKTRFFKYCMQSVSVRPKTLHPGALPYLPPFFAIENLNMKK